MDPAMMIVDDIEMNRAILKKIFQEEFDFIEASSGEEAIALLRKREQKIDFMLLDISMPGISGIEFLYRYRNEPCLQGVPIVVITSSDKADDQLEAFDAGANEFITKPFNPRVVRTRVQNVWASSERLREIEREKQLLAAKAARDAMTGLLNKPAAEAIIRDALATKKTGLHALMMVDIDNFKQVNDQLGHLSGDHVIKLIAQEMNNVFRKEDVISRFGGDEFCVFLSDLPGKDVARNKAQALSGAVMLQSDRQAAVPFSISIGIAYAQPGCSCEELIGWADEALYISKANGKARVSEYSFGEDQAVEITEITESDAHVRNLLNRIPTGMGILYIFADHRMRFGYFNDSFYAMLGERREERMQYVGSTLFESLHPEDVQRAMDVGQAVVRDGRNGLADVRLRRRDGSYHWYRVQAGLTARTERYATLYMTFLDIDELRTQQLETKALRDAMDAAVQSEQISLWRFDLDTKEILRVYAPSVEGIHQVGQQVPQSVVTAGLIHPEHAAAYCGSYEAIYAGQGKSSCTVQVFSRKMGCYEWKRIVLIRQPDANDGEHTAIGFSIPIAPVTAEPTDSPMPCAQQ